MATDDSARMVNTRRCSALLRVRGSSGIGTVDESAIVNVGASKNINGSENKYKVQVPSDGTFSLHTH